MRQWDKLIVRIASRNERETMRIQHNLGHRMPADCPRSFKKGGQIVLPLPNGLTGHGCA